MRRIQAILLSVVLACVAIPVMAFGEDLSWHKIFEKSMSSNEDALYYVAAGDARHVIAFGGERTNNGTAPVLLITRDGEHFQHGAMPQSPNPMIPVVMFGDIFMVSYKTGYATNLMGGIFKTTRTGTSWELTGFPTTEYPIGLYCLDENRCFATGDEKLYITSDGFANTNTITIPNLCQDCSLTDVFFLDDSTGFVFGGGKVTELDDETYQEKTIETKDGFILKTTDGGANWTEIFHDDHFVVDDVVFVNEQFGAVSGHYLYDNGSNMKAQAWITTDGGANWRELIGPQGSAPIVDTGLNGSPLYSIGGIYFFDEQEGWIIGNYGYYQPEGGGLGDIPVYFHTTDGGNTFEVVMDDEESGHNIHGVSFCGRNCAYAVGWGHKVFRLGDLPSEPDGDTDDIDGTDNPDNDGLPTDGDEEEIQPGSPGYPCYNPNDESLPECNPTLGANTCLFNDEGSFCTRPCNVTAECGSEFDSCCKEMTVDGETQKFCVWDMNLCQNDEKPQYSVSEGAKLGEACKLAGVSGTEDLPECGKAWGAEICIGGPYGTFCSKQCQSNTDCPESNCCADIRGKKYCIYGDELIGQMCPETQVDGDDDGAIQGEIEDTATPAGSGEKSSSDDGCSASSMMLWPWVLLVIVGIAGLIRRKNVRIG